jgi:osmotically-inducible protein OsmY
MRLLVLLVAGGWALAGCAHTDDPPRSAWEKTQNGFATAYDGVQAGAKQVAHAGGWVLVKAGDGVVRVMYETHMGKVARLADDAWITSKLKGEYGLDPDVKANQIHIKTRDGVVTLKGAVDSAYSAQKAIKRALDTEGVVMVDSQLTYPTMANQSKTFLPGEKVKIRE